MQYMQCLCISSHKPPRKTIATYHVTLFGCQMGDLPPIWSSSIHTPIQIPSATNLLMSASIPSMINHKEMPRPISQKWTSSLDSRARIHPTQRIPENQKKGTFVLKMIQTMLGLFVANWPLMPLLTRGVRFAFTFSVYSYAESTRGSFARIVMARPLPAGIRHIRLISDSRRYTTNPALWQPFARWQPFSSWIPCTYGSGPWRPKCWNAIYHIISSKAYCLLTVRMSHSTHVGFRHGSGRDRLYEGPLESGCGWNEERRWNLRAAGIQSCAKYRTFRKGERCPRSCDPYAYAEEWEVGLLVARNGAPQAVQDVSRCRRSAFDFFWLLVGVCEGRHGR